MEPEPVEKEIKIEEAKQSSEEVAPEVPKRVPEDKTTKSSDRKERGRREKERRKASEEEPPLRQDPAHSNSWVISGRHTENGMPLLASDPHLTATVPSLWQP